LLLLDANVVIELCELGLWGLVLEKCEVLLARTVLEVEAQFYEDEDGEKVYLDLEEDVKQNRLQVVDVPLKQITAFMALFKPLYVGALDPGEKESLTYLVNAKDKHYICSADKIVFRVLGALDREDQGISLAFLLKQLGETRKLAHEFSEEYRELWTKKGKTENFLGQALK